MDPGLGLRAEPYSVQSAAAADDVFTRGRTPTRVLVPQA
jgi:hypothetical protein